MGVWWVRSDGCGLFSANLVCLQLWKTNTHTHKATHTDSRPNTLMFWSWCASLQTVVLVLYAMFVINKMILLPVHGFGVHVVLFSTICILSVISHSRCQFTDPGCLPRNYVRTVTLFVPVFSVLDCMFGLQSAYKHIEPRYDESVDYVNSELPRMCKRCKTVKPYGTHHCSCCGR